VKSKPEDYWQNPGFAYKYARNNLEGIEKNLGVQQFNAQCMLGIMQGISYLCRKPEKVMDAGCGPGHRGIAVRANMGCYVLGLDYSNAMLEQANKLLKVVGPKHQIDLVRGDVTSLQQKTDSFDVVFAYGLLMSIPDGQKAVDELMRISKYGLVTIDETDRIMTPIQLQEYTHIKEEVFPGRIYWHDYMKLFGKYRNTVMTPLKAPDTWDLGQPPPYARFIVSKSILPV